jgi:hypothetical protein
MTATSLMFGRRSTNFFVDGILAACCVCSGRSGAMGQREVEASAATPRALVFVMKRSLRFHARDLVALLASRGSCHAHTLIYPFRLTVTVRMMALSDAMVVPKL